MQEGLRLYFRGRSILGTLLLRSLCNRFECPQFGSEWTSAPDDQVTAKST